MTGVHSKTGLLASNKRTTIRYQQRPTLHLKAVAIPAPYTLKPFAGLYNPYSYGCSLLCNHPADNEAKGLLKKAKDTWATEGKYQLLAEEVAAIRVGLEQIQAAENRKSPPNIYEAADNVETVPEELFRRYTETDSRPHTPAPTVISNYTRTSASRRCLTPDPIPTSEVKERTQLILDLRRSHSQETIPWFGAFGPNEPPIIRIQQVPTRSHSPDSSTSRGHGRRSSKIIKAGTQVQQTRQSRPQTLRPKTEVTKTKTEVVRPKSCQKIEPEIEVTPPRIELDGEKMMEEEAVEEEEEEDDDDEKEDGTMKRRGRKRHKKGRDSARGPLAVQSSVDPETQIATIGIDSHNPSARPSLVSNELEDVPIFKPLEERKTSLDVNSFLDREILKQLRRELNEEVVDNEFNFKRRKALEEALKTVTKNKIECEELKALQKELQVPTVDVDFWISLPRVFSRSSARFELPMDSRMFSTLTPIDYIKDHITITSARKLLYNCVFNRNKIEYELEDEHLREISGKSLRTALGEMMGRPMGDKHYGYFRELVGWKDSEVFDFKTFSGICALCERILASEFCWNLPSKKDDPCHEIEVADFESLERRLKNQRPDYRLLKIMYAIRDS